MGDEPAVIDRPVPLELRVRQFFLHSVEGAVFHRVRGRAAFAGVSREPRWARITGTALAVGWASWALSRMAARRGRGRT